jgi:glycosyltransferase involved in cell wall biosynthesis
MDTISVIMPVYNGEQFIGKAIESVLNQTCKDFELIIINDGSIDSTGKIIANYRKTDRRINIISRENRGLVYSLNEGISLAKGKYIARMDADDISLPTRLEKQLQYMGENNVDILGTCVEVIGDISCDEKARHEEWLNIPLGEDVAKTILTHWYCLAHPSIMIKRDIFTKLEGYRNYCAEDLDLWLRALKNGFTIAKLGGKLLRYRIHPASKSVNDNQTYRGIKDGIRLKLNFVFEDDSRLPDNYLIWGAGNGGRITREVVGQAFPKALCAGFIDPYKEGSLEGTAIYSPAELKDLSFDYIFIATEPGKKGAMFTLSNLGLENIRDYLCTI